MVCIVPFIPDRHVLYHTIVYAQNVVSLGMHLPTPSFHDPRPSVPQPRLAWWEEMRTYVLQARRGKGLRNLLVPSVSLCQRQVGVEFTGHQQILLMGLLVDGPDDFIYVRGDVWGQITPHNIPKMSYRCQLKSDNVQDVELERLQGEVLRIAVEHDNATTVRDQQLGRHDPVPT